MEKNSKVFVAGHQGLAGSALMRRLHADGFHNLAVRAHAELDLTDQEAVRSFFAAEGPDYVFLAAARVGGVLANRTYPADFIRDNLLIQTNVIDAAWRAGARKLLFLASSAVYPDRTPQPMKEEHLLSGRPQEVNEWYAIAKTAGIKMCQAYRRQHGFSAICLIPTNLYGPRDNFDLETSHVMPALLRRFHEAKASGASQVVVWGTGDARREFLHADDLAAAVLFLMEKYDSEEIINVGVGEDVSIRELARLIADTVGYSGDIVFDASKPEGATRRLLDVSRLRSLGWAPTVALREGVARTYGWYREQGPGAQRQ
jgi:GDP-L-fucose synthase